MFDLLQMPPYLKDIIYIVSVPSFLISVSQRLYLFFARHLNLFLKIFLSLVIGVSMINSLTSIQFAIPPPTYCEWVCLWFTTRKKNHSVREKIFCPFRDISNKFWNSINFRFFALGNSTLFILCCILANVKLIYIY